MDLNGLAPIRKLDIGILRQTLNTDNLNTDESKVKNKGVEHLPEIFRLIASLEDDTQKMLLDSWAKLEMPLNEKTVGQLLEYLGNKPALNTQDKMAVIKAFAFLESNGLPYSEKFVDALRSIFNNNGNLAADLEQYINSNNSISEEQLSQLLENSSLSELKESIIDLNSLTEPSQNTLNKEAAASTQNLNVQNPESTPAPPANNENISNLSPDFLNSFNNLDQETKTLILNNLDTTAKNFDQNTIKILNNYLAENNIESFSEKTAVLKSFAFLENNQLPLAESLVDEMKTNFQNSNLENMISEIESKNELFKNLLENNSSIINKNESTLDLNTEAAKIAAKLNDFSKISDQIVSLFNKSGGESEEKIADNFLGQKIINLQQQDINTPLMLALEIPVQLQENKMSSLLLKIEKNSGDENKAEQSNTGYNITFILEFENIGPIKSNININQKKINTSFFTESHETAELIKDNIAKLQSALYKNDFEINRVHIENFEDFEEEKTKFFNKIILPELNDSNQEGKYRHIDINSTFGVRNH